MSVAYTDSFTVRAPAKINLHLGVGAVREDGYHPLDTVYQAVSLYDDLTVHPADEWSLSTIAAPHLGEVVLPGPGANIVDRVAELLLPGGAHPARVEVAKAIPIAGGMAGGSADAAAALIALDRLWDLQTPDVRLLEIAAELGSDVPFALVGGSAHGTGRGEHVVPLVDVGSWAWVVVPDTGGLSTPAVYRHFDALYPDAPATPASARPVLDALATGDPLRLARTLHNDLQEPAIDLAPHLGELIDRGEAEGALRGLVSGSGPTCVFLCASAESAREVAAGLAATRPNVLLAHGPVAGAHLVEMD